MIRPIFIIGSPRSGTTLVLEVMATHEELAWVSNAVNIAPRHLYLSLVNDLYE
ncbi:MAG: sulfotransferase [Planctomycetota bacterium]